MLEKTPSEPKAAIREQALALGFDAVGFAPAAVSETAREGLAGFLAAGCHGDMGWLAAATHEACGRRPVAWSFWRPTTHRRATHSPC